MQIIPGTVVVGSIGSVSGWQGESLTYGTIVEMSKKIPAAIVLAALATEIVFNEHHDQMHQPPHTEIDVKLPVQIVAAANASGAGRAMSATVTITPNDAALTAQPHIEPPPPPPVVDFELNQIS
jgi:hypothetical protein